MKKIILILFALISFNCVAQYQYLGSGASTTKLLLHLNGNSLDASGNSNNGTDSLITYGLNYGKFGKGASFNGSGSKIKLPNSSNINTSITFSCWFKTSSTANGQLFSKGSDLSDGWGISFLKASNRLFLEVITTVPSIVQYSSTLSAISIPLNKWNHALFVFDNENRIGKTYFNGKLNETTGTTGTVTRGSDNIFIGVKNILSYQYFFNGSIDEVILENRAWTSSEIKRYYTFSKAWFFGLNDEQKHDLKYLDWFIPKQMAA